jgi:putative toxin of predicted polymorphic toxin system
MSMTKQFADYGRTRATKRLIRSVPWIGGLVVLATLGSTIGRKGVVRGALDTALDFIPFVGGIKNAAEVARGRDFIPDRS